MRIANLQMTVYMNIYKVIYTTILEDIRHKSLKMRKQKCRKVKWHA